MVILKFLIINKKTYSKFGSDNMNYDELLKILLFKNVYEQIKEHEKEIFELIPELKVCKGFNQNNKWHIYDVYEHTLHVVSGVDNDKCLRLAALFHDIGKPLTYTEDENKKGHFYNHWNESVRIFKQYQDRFHLSELEIELITSLIYYHDINLEKMTKEELELLIEKIGIENIELLFCLKRADLLAQSPEFHGLLTNINNQEQAIIKVKK